MVIMAANCFLLKYPFVHLATFYSSTCILKHNIIPEVFTMGVIIPILKKPSLNPNVANNYRPITLSSTLAKLMELMITPSDDISDTQFGFRRNRGTAFGCALLNDLTYYYTANGSPLFIYMCTGCTKVL